MGPQSETEQANKNLLEADDDDHHHHRYHLTSIGASISLQFILRN
jgi:hypothetical protein